MRNHLHGLAPSFHITKAETRPFVCPRVTVLHTTWMESAHARPAASSTSAFTVETNTPPWPVPTPKGTPALAKALPTSVKAQKLFDLLDGYDQTERLFLYNRFTEGFIIPGSGQKHIHVKPNHASALSHPHIVDIKLQQELAAGRVAGPFPSPPLPNLIVSPIGLIPKKEPGSFHLIHDLSCPKGSSVNDSIPREHCAVQCETLDTVIRHILHCGRGALLAKTDIQDAFRICPINPVFHYLLGFRWRGY